jgi:TM2 domain-containing membrane protein YozV
VGTPEPRSIRIGTAEREQAVRALVDHFAQGRLTPDEFEERMTAAYAARTADELDKLFDDLPRPAPPAGPQYPGAQYPGAQHPGAPYSGAHHPGAHYPGAEHPDARYPGSPYPGLPATTSLPQPFAGPSPTGPFPSPHPGPPLRHPAVPVGYDPAAPYGREPLTGQPYSDRSKVIAGVLQLFVPIGLGRLYAGHTGIGIAQLVLALFFGVGVIWAFIDGIVILAGRPTDGKGRPLRP